MRSAFPRRRFPLLLLTLAFLLLAACSSPPPESTDDTLRTGTVQVPAETPVPPIIGSAIVMMEFAPIEATSTVTQVFENLYLGPVSPIGPEGAVELVFPVGSDVPAAVLSPAEESILNIGGMPGCTLTATDPSVMVSTVAFEGASVPGVALITAEGLYLAMTTGEELTDLDSPSALANVGSQTWVYATGPTRLTTSPAICDSDFPEGGWYSVDAELTTGWNHLEWVMVADELGTFEGVRLGNSTAEELHFYAAFRISASEGDTPPEP